ncbi:MAG TPA: hypothetical protein VJU61_22645, partial [Polyangiaceae bacterium]|nr:hypothetical protein [Polyangiaceae bacterium]
WDGRPTRPDSRGSFLGGSPARPTRLGKAYVPTAHLEGGSALSFGLRQSRAWPVAPTIDSSFPRL